MIKFMWFVFGLFICLSLGVIMPLGQWLGVPDAAFLAWLTLMSIAIPISMAGMNGLLPNQDASVFN